MRINRDIAFRLSAATLALVVALLLVFRPWTSTSSSSSSGAPERKEERDPDRANGPVRLDDPLLSSAIADTLRPHNASDERVFDMFQASLKGDYAALESVAKRFGGGFRSTVEEYEPMRRTLRAWPPSSRPEFAREWSQTEWERWVDAASRTELLSLPHDPTHSTVRSIDARTISATVIPEFNAQSLRDLETSLRDFAGREGLTVPADARMTQAMGRFVYADPTDATPRNPEMLVVTLRGQTLDDRDFVAAYLFARRGQSGWLPFRVAAFSSVENEDDENPSFPFVPAF